MLCFLYRTSSPIQDCDTNEEEFEKKKKENKISIGSRKDNCY